MQESADNRRKKSLWAVVREFVDTAEPVGSGTSVAKHDFGVSPATVRNDMAVLEEQGLLKQPHTSAGRIPTELGYRYFVNQFIGSKPKQAEHRRQLVEVQQAVQTGLANNFLSFVQSLAKLTKGTVFVSTNDGRFHLAGMENLFRHPEFRDEQLLFAVTRTLDRLDQVLAELESRMTRDVDVLIGEENPFGRGTSVIVLRYKTSEMGEGIIGLLGPQRMDYQSNYSLMRCLREALIK